MKISQINFNLPNYQKQRVFIPAKINFQRQNKDTFIKSDSFSNEQAIKLIREKLAECMTKKELDIYMDKLGEICQKLGIEPKDLPIDKEHQGNLKDYQRTQISFLVKEDAISG